MFLKNAINHEFRKLFSKLNGRFLGHPVCTFLWKPFRFMRLHVITALHQIKQGILKLKILYERFERSVWIHYSKVFG